MKLQQDEALIFAGSRPETEILLPAGEAGCIERLAADNRSWASGVV